MKRPATAAPTIKNRKASFQYDLSDQVECGIVLTGSEIKSVRAGKVSLDEAFAFIRRGEVFLKGCNIAPYPQAGPAQHDPLRERKLLLHRREIAKLGALIDQQGLTLVPIKIRFSERGQAKIVIAVGRGKKLHDKRQSVKAREADREIRRAMARRR